MKITKTEVFVLGDPLPTEAVDMSRIDGLAFVRIEVSESCSRLGSPLAMR